MSETQTPRDWLKEPYAYHCATHGWWDAKRESGCPLCVSILRLELAASERRCEELRAALERSKDALDDWLCTYVRDDGFLNEDIQRSEQRISGNGGTIAYISSVQAQNKVALAAQEPTGSR